MRKTELPKTRPNPGHWGGGDLACSREGFPEEWVDHEDWAKSSRSGKTLAGARKEGEQDGAGP